MVIKTGFFCHLLKFETRLVPTCMKTDRPEKPAGTQNKMDHYKIGINDLQKVEYSDDGPYRSHNNHDKINELNFFMYFFQKRHNLFLRPTGTWPLFCAYFKKMQGRKRLGIHVFFLMVLFLPLTTLAQAAQPVAFGQITSVPGWRKDPFGSGKKMYHRGYDIAVPIGTQVFPTQTGTISYAGKYKGYGNLVAVDHGNGNVTLYGHLSRILVDVGMPVTTTTLIALSGNTGRSTGPHLHYEIRQWPVSAVEKSPLVTANGTPAIEHDDDVWIDAQSAVPGQQPELNDLMHHGFE